jgi:ribonuclease BN (tRNA processing enzyme)
MALAAAGISLLASLPASAHERCAAEPLMVQVLGSGGPHAGDDRASSGYLVWRNGRAVVLVDAGGGTFLRFGQAGAQLEDLALLAISHLHPDHVSDLPALLWLSDLVRQRPLKLVGPSGTDRFPAIDAFVARLFDSANGAFPMLAGTLGQPGAGARLELVTVDAASSSPTRVLLDGDLEVSALGVPHADVPTVAYRIRVGERSVVFGSDQAGTDSKFVSFAKGADLLVMHLALSAQAPDGMARIHARPATVAEIARYAAPGHLVLSHLIRAPSQLPAPQWFSLSDVEQALAEIGKHYSGTFELAEDLRCIAIR